MHPIKSCCPVCQGLPGTTSQNGYGLILCRLPGKGIDRDIQLSQGVTDRFKKALAVFVQLNAVAPPGKQIYPQLLLQPSYRGRDGRRRDHILLGCFCKAFCHGAFIKITQLEHFHRRIPPFRLSYHILKVMTRTFSPILYNFQRYAIIISESFPTNQKGITIL